MIWGRPVGICADARWGGGLTVEQHASAGGGEQDGQPVEKPWPKIVPVQRLEQEWPGDGDKGARKVQFE